MLGQTDEILVRIHVVLLRVMSEEKVTNHVNELLSATENTVSTIQECQSTEYDYVYLRKVFSTL